MKFQLEFDVVYKTTATCTIEAENLASAEMIAKGISLDYAKAEAKILDDWEEDESDRTLTVKSVEEV